MYTSIKRLAMFSFILAIFCVIAALLLMIHFADYAFILRFTWSLFVITVAVGLLLISWGLFDLSKDLDREYSATSEYLHKLNQRIKQLEDKTQL
ncbi:MAG: hypothetical protein IJZ56_06290 [Oscillospiraceae bacterium]|nr:hypothetical protein [Oscillospiraceae bacterium]